MSTIYFSSHQAHTYKVDSWRHIFSQWYQAKTSFIGAKSPIYDLEEFISDDLWNVYVEGKDYWLREQWMMHLKALIFARGENKQHNLDIAEQIMSTTNPAIIKGLGRQVKGYDETVWNACRFKVVVNGNYLQFTQNKEMKDILMSTNDRELVEASAKDAIWGIGFNESAAKKVEKSQWGTNLLGKAIMEVRDYLKQ
jgi:hypothetical protein